MATRRRKITRSAVRRVKRRESKNAKLRSLRSRKNSSKRMRTHQRGGGGEFIVYTVHYGDLALLKATTNIHEFPPTTIVGILCYNPTNNELHLFGNNMFGKKSPSSYNEHGVITQIIITLVSKLIGIPVNFKNTKKGDLSDLFTFNTKNGLNLMHVPPWGGYSWPYYYFKFSGKQLSYVTKRQEPTWGYTAKNPIYKDEFISTDIPIETPTIPTTLGNGTFSSITAGSTPPALSETEKYNYPAPPLPRISSNPEIKIGYLFYKLPDDLQTKFKTSEYGLKRESTPGNTAFEILTLLNDPQEVKKLESPADDSPILLL